MFSSDKDLRKPVAKKVIPPRQKKIPNTMHNEASPTSETSISAQKCSTTCHTQLSNVTADGSDILEVAKKEREYRSALRERSVFILRIQKWFRGRIVARKLYSSFSDTVLSKLDDIEKITTLLGQKGTEFVTPPDIAHTLLSQYIYLSRYAPSASKLHSNRVCTFIINPCCSELDPTKNLVACQHQKDGSMRRLRTLTLHLISLLCEPVNRTKNIKGNKRTNTAYILDKARLAYSLQVLLGATAPHKIRYSPALEAAFGALRSILLARCNLLTLLRDYFFVKGEHLLSMTSSTDSTTGMTVTGSMGSAYQTITAARAKSNVEGDRIFGIILFLHDCSGSASDSRTTQSRRLAEFAAQFLTIPMLTLLLTPSALNTLWSWASLPALIEVLRNPNDIPLGFRQTTGHSCLRIISPGQWLLGNLAALSIYVPFASLSQTSTTAAAAATTTKSSAEHSSSTTTTTMSGQQQHQQCSGFCAVLLSEQPSLSTSSLASYLDACTLWLSAYVVPELLQGRSGILWQRQGSNSTAVAVPSGLEEQILTLLHSDVLTQLNRRIIQCIDAPTDALCTADGDIETVKNEWAHKYGNAKDIAEVADSLASTAYIITHKTLKDHQEASTWFTAKWAGRIASSLTGGLTFSGFGSSSSSNATKKNSSPSSTISKEKRSSSSTVGSPAAENPVLIQALCRLWSLLLSGAANAQPDSLPWKALSQLAFSTNIVPKLWCFLLGRISIEKLTDFHVYLNPGVDVFRLSSSSNNSCSAKSSSSTLADHLPVLYTITCLLRMLLIVLDDSELYDAAKPIPLHQVLRLVRCLKQLLFKALMEDFELFNEGKPQLPSTNEKSAGAGAGAGTGSSIGMTMDLEIWTSCKGTERRVLRHSMRAISTVLSDLYARWARRPFSSAALWHIKEASASALGSDHTSVILRIMPWAVDFHERMQWFRSAVDAEKLQVQGSNDLLSGGPQRSRGTIVRIRKTRVLEDGLEAMSKVGSAIKDRIHVKYVNDFGEEEAGIDAGGLFKDFVTDLSGRIFDPSYGLFCTTAENLLYPNPSASMLFDPHEMDGLYVFLGRVLGKAMFENITLQPQFAHFFLAFMHGKYNYMNLINDLHTLDPELYKNLMFLKTYEGDIADLGLTFSVSDTSMGGQREVELIPGGSSMDVTALNKHRYINLAAKYYLHDRLKRQAKAFFSGLHQVIRPELLSMFCSPELQILISGSQSGLSIEDLRQYTRYAGGYLSVDHHIQRFWSVFAELSSEDQALLLKFVTSCERPPSLGFASLQPPFTIQRVECSDDQRLPTASTCFNILKLPTYSSAKVMKEKLLQSIRAKAGFDLS